MLGNRILFEIPGKALILGQYHRETETGCAGSAYPPTTYSF